MNSGGPASPIRVKVQLLKVQFCIPIAPMTDWREIGTSQMSAERSPSNLLFVRVTLLSTASTAGPIIWQPSKKNPSRTSLLASWGSVAIRTGTPSYLGTLDRLRQLLVGQCLGFQEPQNSVAEQERVFSIVEAEGHLIEIGGQRLDAELVVRTDDRALEKRPDALYRVGMHVGPNPLMLPVIDRLMGCVVVGNVRRDVALPAVRHNAGRVGVNRLLDELGQITTGVMLFVPPTASAAALDGTQDHCLFFLFPAADVPPLAADPRLVHFDDAGERDRVLVLHSRTDAMGQVERGLVGGAQFALELVGRDALARLANQVGGSEPFPERQVAVGKDGASRDRELVAA